MIPPIMASSSFHLYRIGALRLSLYRPSSSFNLYVKLNHLHYYYTNGIRNIHTSPNNDNTKPPLPVSQHNPNNALASTQQQHDYATSPRISPLLDRIVPPSWIPYAQLARMDKPIGTLLLLYPCLWSSALAAHPILLLDSPSSSYSHHVYTMVVGDPYTITLCTLGAFIMRGAGCTINDMWDAQYDARVARTQHRPLASGTLSLFPQATLFLGGQLTLGLAVLSAFPSQHLPFCLAVGISSMPLVLIYPIMKRWTHWPQLVLGLTFNWGTWMGWAAMHGSFSELGTAAGGGLIVQGWSVLVPLYVGSVAWTLVYDTLYAHQDKVDDEKLGLKSTALYFGKDDMTQRWILSSFSLVAGGGWIISGYQVGLDIDQLWLHPFCSLYYVGCLGAMGHLLWQVHTAKFDDVKNLSHRFKSNSVVGALMFGSCIMGNVGLYL